MDMKKLKVANPMWAGYTGTFGPHAFVDGVSVDYLPRNIRDRLAASMSFVEINEDGSEEPAGSVHRLVRDAAARLEPREPMVRQTDEERKAELVQIALQSTTAAPNLHSRAELEAIAEKGGIRALREVASKWGAKHRSIPVLIEAVLVEQEKFTANRNKRIADAAVAELEAKGIVAVQDDAPVSAIGIDDEIPTTEAPLDPPDDEDLTDEETKAIQAAAASGNLAAALSSESE